jgi:tryptophan halogenase
VPRLALRFEHWSAGGVPWLHVHGDHGLPCGGAPFHQIWAAARRARQAEPFHLYAAAGALAAADRFALPRTEPESLLSTFDYALRLHPPVYAAQLAALAGKRLLRARGEVGGIQRREDGGVAALLLTDGRRFEADLFLDCAGPSAPLLSRLDDTFEDWSGALPADRLLIGTARAPSAPAAADLVAATGIGWRWAVPFPGRTETGLVYAASAATEARARRVLSAEAGADEAEAVAIRPGRRPRPWIHNVLALGDAAIAVDPLEWTNLYLAQSGIMRALELLPGRDCHPLELVEYIRRSDWQALRIRDFLALHYLRSGRMAGAFWRGLARRPLPASLADTLHHFQKRGRLPFHEEESFTRESWLAVLFGLGLVPDHADPGAAIRDPEEAFAALRRFAERVQAETRDAPLYRDSLSRLSPAHPAEG